MTDFWLLIDFFSTMIAFDVKLMEFYKNMRLLASHMTVGMLNKLLQLQSFWDFCHMAPLGYITMIEYYLYTLLSIVHEVHDKH